MKLNQLKKLRAETERFLETVKKAEQLASKVKGWEIGNDETLYGQNDIKGTALSGAVKREFTSLKYNGTQIINHP